MRDRAIHFEDQGQGYETWILDEEDNVIESIPEGNDKFKGCKVEWPYPLRTGDKLAFTRPDGSTAQLRVKIAAIEKIK